MTIREDGGKMSRGIRVLPDELVNLIAAGEVVERPAAVVKELLENALDASSDRVRVHLLEGGRREIKVTDNGVGMGRDDALLSIERHATSKISAKADLDNLTSYGFRGEALPSIAAVGRFTIETWSGVEEAGTGIVVDNGRLLSVHDSPAVQGTSVSIKSIFSRLPARRKFLRKTDTELSWCIRAVEEAALARPDVHFEVTGGTGTVIMMAPVTGLRERVWAMWGQETASRLMRLDAAHKGVHVEGFISPPDLTYSRRTRHHVLINARPVRDPGVTRLLTDALSTKYPSGRHPALILSISMPPGEVDVNVHPSKREVRLHRPREVSAALRKAVESSGTGSAEGIYTVRQTTLRTGTKAMEPEAGWKGKTDGTSTGGVGAEPDIIQLSSKPDVRIIGQVLGTYIICEVDGKLLLVDQHAAHERILFNRLMETYTESAGPSQGLVVPVVLHMGPAEMRNLANKLPLMEAFGFRLEEFGDNTVRVTAMPADMPQDLSVDVLQSLSSDLDDVPAVPEKIALQISRWACRQSVRAGRSLSGPEMEQLIADLEAAESGYSCPHGRPTRIYMTQEDLEKMFKRR